MRSSNLAIHRVTSRTGEPRQRAVALVLVLVAATIAFILVATYVTGQSTFAQISRNVEDRARARGVAESGLRLAVAYLNRETSWRTEQSNGTWVAGASFGGGAYSIVGEDGEDADGDGTISIPAEGDADLADDPTDLLTLTVNASYNGSTYVARAVVRPVTQLGDLLLVVGDAGSPTTADDFHRQLFTNWGWTVSLLDDGASSSTYNSAAAASRVVFVSESASASAVGTKLKTAAVGVVLEQMDLGDEFGLTQSQDTKSNRHGIDIVDNTHFITTGFSTGSVDVFSADQTMHRQMQTIAAGAVVLAEHPVDNKPSLYVVDTGGGLYGGGSAAGRRVQLPWGQGVDYTTLTGEGRTLMRRALDWAAQPAGGALLAHWKLDETEDEDAADSTGNGYDGKLKNMTPETDWVTGYIDGALDLDGNNDYIELPGFPNLTGSFTVTAWINPVNTLGDQRILCDDRNNSAGYALSLGDGGSGRLRFFCRALNPVSVDSSAAITAGTWQFVAGVHDAAARQRRLYLGGTQIGGDPGSYSGTWGTDSGIAAIGGEPDGSSEATSRWRFGGRIDDVRVYNGALTAEALAALAAGGGTATGYTYQVRWTN